MGFLDRFFASRAEVNAAKAEAEASRNESSALMQRLILASRNERQSGTSSGVDIVNGQFRYEVAPQLIGRERWNTFAGMVTDPRVLEALQSVTLPLLTAQWSYAPASDSPLDVEVAEFCNAVLLRKSSQRYGSEYWCQSSWAGQRLPEILCTLQHGYSLFAVSWRSVGMKRVFDRLQWLEPSSVDSAGWQLTEDDQLVGVVRTYREPSGALTTQETIPARDLMLYVWGLRGARYEGEPLIRSMYGAWIRKVAALKHTQQAIRRLGNPVPHGSYPSTFTSQDRASFEEFVKMLRGTSPDYAYGVFPKGADGSAPQVEFAGADVQDIDRMRSIIDGENAEIAHAGASKTSILGETATGSRAVGEVQRGSEVLLIRSVVTTIVEQEMHGVGAMPGLVQRLVEVNFPRAKALPSLKVGKITADEGLEQLAPLRDAVKDGLIPRHPEVQKRVCAMFGLELPDDAFENEPMRPENTADPDIVSPEAARDVRAEAARLTAADALSLPAAPSQAAKGYGRQPTQFEAAVVSLSVVSSSLSDSEQSMFGTLQAARKEFVADIIARGRDGKIAPETVSSLRRSKPRRGDQYASRMRQQFASIAYQGREHAAQELDRQSALKLEAVPPGGKPEKKHPDKPKSITAPKDLLAVLVGELKEEAHLSVGITLDALWSRMLNESVAEWERLRRSGVSGDELWSQLEAFLYGLADRPLQDTARQVSTIAYNQGRDIAAKMAARSGAADYALRSEVLDAVTCGECEKLDGTLVSIGSAEYEALMPPARCEGRDRCRGFYVVVARSVTQQMAEE